MFSTTEVIFCEYSCICLVLEHLELAFKLKYIGKMYSCFIYLLKWSVQWVLKGSIKAVYIVRAMDISV